MFREILEAKELSTTEAINAVEKIMINMTKKVGTDKGWGATIAWTYMDDLYEFDKKGIDKLIKKLEKINSQVSEDSFYELEDVIQSLGNYKEIVKLHKEVGGDLVEEAWDTLDWPKWITRNSSSETQSDIDKVISGFKDDGVNQEELVDLEKLLIAQSNYINSVEESLYALQG